MPDITSISSVKPCDIHTSSYKMTIELSGSTCKETDNYCRGVNPQGIVCRDRVEERKVKND